MYAFLSSFLSWHVPNSAHRSDCVTRITFHDKQNSWTLSVSFSFSFLLPLPSWAHIPSLILCWETPSAADPTSCDVPRFISLPKLKNCNSVYLNSYILDRQSHLHFQNVIQRVYLTFMGPCIANIFSEYNQQDANFLSLFISVRHSTCFRRYFRPSSGAQNCIYSVRHLSNHYCYLLLTAGSSNGLTNAWRCMSSFELLMMDGNTVWNM